MVSRPVCAFPPFNFISVSPFSTSSLPPRHHMNSFSSQLNFPPSGIKGVFPKNGVSAALCIMIGIVGSTGTGKSTMILQFTQDNFVSP